MMQNHSADAAMIKQATEWAMMHGVAFRQADGSARHCPFSLTPTTLDADHFAQLQQATPLIAKLIHAVSEDHDFLQQTLAPMAKADPFFGQLLQLHQQAHGDHQQAKSPARQPLLLMRTDYMDDAELGPKVIEFNGIAAGMAPFGQKATELHRYLLNQWPNAIAPWLASGNHVIADNHGLQQLALAIANTAKRIRDQFADAGAPTFLMVVQADEDNVYDQHLLEFALQNLGVRTFRRTFEQLSQQLSSGDGNRLMLEQDTAIDVVYLRAGYQYRDYWAPQLDGERCCHTLSQTRLFIEQHHVALNATISQQLVTSKSMQMQLTMMAPQQYQRWGLTLAEAKLVQAVLAPMKPVTPETIEWFLKHADKQSWVLKNQGEGGGHCIFGDDIAATLRRLSVQEYDAWALMLRLRPQQRPLATIAVRDGNQRRVDDLISEIGLFTAHFNGQAMTEFDGYAGYLIRSKPASENEGGIHSGQGILDSLMLI